METIINTLPILFAIVILFILLDLYFLIKKLLKLKIRYYEDIFEKDKINKNL
jgi:hypothetical protein